MERCDVPHSDPAHPGAERHNTEEEERLTDEPFMVE